MPHQLTTGALEAIISGRTVDKPILQVISTKKISGNSSADRYRLLLSDGKLSYSHAMLATQLNMLMESGEMDSLSIIRLEKYMCNTIQGDRRVMIVLDLHVLDRGSDVGGKIGDPQPYKAGQEPNNNPPAVQADPPPMQNGGRNMNSSAASYKPLANNPYNQGPSKPETNASFGNRNAAPTTPGGNRVHSINSLTPYQNRWKICARVTNKSAIKTWSNSRGEGKLFSFNLLDDSGEIRATGFNEAVDKYYDMLEMNKVYYVSKATLKTANRQYTSLKCDYEMTINHDTIIEPCNEDVTLPTMSFEFVKINELNQHQANDMIDVIGIVKTTNDVATVTGRLSNKEVTKRDLHIVDQTGMCVNLTLWGTDAEKFDGSQHPVIAVKGCKVSEFGGRSLSVLHSSQLIMNPDIRESHMLRGWFDRDGHQMDFGKYDNSGGGGGSGFSTNWKSFSQVKSENIGQGEKPDYFTSRGTVIFLKRENCMYMACPADGCNKKVIDQNNGMFRCEKCNKEYPNHKWRLILSANLADYSDNQWATFFQDTGEILLGKTADELGALRDTDEAAFEQVFSDALFKSYIFKMRAKVETYNDESRLKTVCVAATPMDWVEHGRHLLDEINKLTAA